MDLRIKRGKSTYFVNIPPTHTIAQLKQQLTQYFFPTIQPTSMRCYQPGGKTTFTMINGAPLHSPQSVTSVLLDDKVLINTLIGDLVFLTFLVEGSTTKWEEVDIPQAEPLESEVVQNQ